LEKAFRLYCDAYEKDGSDASAIVELDELSQMSFEYFSRKTDARGICFLGVWHHHRKQYDRALELFTKSAGLGDASAMLYLGNMYRYGYGVPVDYSLAFEWISKSAGKHYRNGEFALADCYREGIGVPVDERKASDITMMAR
jgi:TPR repeat protein